MFEGLRFYKAKQETYVPALESLMATPGGDVPALPEDPKEAKRNTIYQYHGIKVYFEKLEGEVRKGVSKSGVAWSNKLPAAYGFIPDTIDADQEAIDIWFAISNFVDSSYVYVIDQINPETKAFDEHKVMMGFGSLEDAKKTYIAAYGGTGEDRIGGITTITLPQLSAWMLGDGPKTAIAGQGLDATAQPVTKAAAALPDRANTRFVNLPKLGRAPFVTTSVNAKTGSITMNLNIITEFSTPLWGQTIEVVVQYLARANKGDRLIIALVSPGGEVTLASRLVAAIRRSQAKTITVAVGGVASAACMVWCEGDDRYVSPAAYLMQHMSSHGDRGPTAAIERKSRAIKVYVRDVMLAKALEIKLISEEDRKQMVDQNRNVYLSATEVVKRTGAKLLRTWDDVK